MNETRSGATPAPTRHPWERAAPPWTPPAPDTGPAMTVTIGAEDEVAASRLVVEATSPRGGLGSAMLGGLVMVTAVTVVLASAEHRWKSPIPSGPSLLAILGLIAGFAGLGWLFGAWILPRLRRAAIVAQARRALGRGSSAAPPDGGGPTRIVLGERALHRTGERVANRLDVSLLRGMVEDGDHMVLRFGLVSVIVLPRRDLTPDQQAAVRGWVARHAREGVA